ncbi:MAG: DUF2079 domain-containing protein [Methanomassiliicoccales archaeon]
MQDLRRAAVPLALVSASSFTILFAVSMLKYLHFLTYDWDLGIMLQSLWTTTHGRLMYETADFSTSGLNSYLEINTAFVGIPVAYLFRLLPTAETLFALQAALVALSSLPLYLIARYFGLSYRLSLLLCLLFLMSFPVVSATFYDFHWEAFLPLEYLLFIAALLYRRNVVYFLILAIGTLTLQVFPFLAAGAALLLLAERQRKWEGMILLLSSALAFLVVTAMQRFLIFPLAGAVAAAGHPPLTYFLVPGHIEPSLSPVYWLLLLAALGFTPLLSPRYLLLSLPWFVESFFLYSAFSSYFGNQYAFIAFPPLAVAAASSLSSLQKRGMAGPSVFLLLISIVIALLGLQSYLLHPSAPAAYIVIFSLLLLTVLFLLFARSHGHTKKHLIERASVFLISLLILNLVLSPLNPQTWNSTPYGGYHVSYAPSPAYGYVVTLSSIVGERATVFASNNLFPYVAKDTHAYSIYTQYSRQFYPYLPFNEANLPKFVFIDTSELLLPPYLMQSIFNESLYGLRAYIFETAYPGTIYLFMRSYTGPTTAYVAGAEPKVQYFDWRSLVIGASGTALHAPHARFGTFIQSKNAYALKEVNVNYAAMWYGPYITLLPGNYDVIMNLSINAPAGTPVLHINSNALYSPFYYSAIIYSNGNSSFRNVTVSIHVSRPYFDTEFRGYLMYIGKQPAGSVELNYIELLYKG